MAYEQMLNITEEYLSKLDVTKGARHKLVLCIQKLKDRYNTLAQVEKNLQNGHAPNSIFNALEELTNIVITPMKPVELYNKECVASQFLKVLDLGECIVLYWVFNRNALRFYMNGMVEQSTTFQMID